jgi:hypothetical protein
MSTGGRLTKIGIPASEAALKRRRTTKHKWVMPICRDEPQQSRVNDAPHFTALDAHRWIKLGSQVARGGNRMIATIMKADMIM